MSKNFTISFATDIESGLKIRDFAKEAHLSLSTLCALGVKALVCALPSDFFRETRPERLEPLLRDIIIRGYEVGGANVAF